MKLARNRMFTTQPTPVERVLVSPPPESVLKCPHCGAARINQWKHLGGVVSTGAHRKQCKSCGTKVHISSDYRHIRIVG
jgi:predicted RNA-binding Zn-ribbon protein involved in translation (DUF1610 family)